MVEWSCRLSLNLPICIITFISSIPWVPHNVLKIYAPELKSICKLSIIWIFKNSIGRLYYKYTSRGILFWSLNDSFFCVFPWILVENNPTPVAYAQSLTDKAAPSIYSFLQQLGVLIYTRYWLWNHGHQNCGSLVK